MPFCNPCPDCDAPRIDLGYGSGNGKCSVCHGSGYGDVFDQLAAVFEKSRCWKCNGSTVCQTCGGSGELTGSAQFSDTQSTSYPTSSSDSATSSGSSAGGGFGYIDSVTESIGSYVGIALGLVGLVVGYKSAGGVGAVIGLIAGFCIGVWTVALLAIAVPLAILGLILHSFVGDPTTSYPTRVNNSVNQIPVAGTNRANQGLAHSGAPSSSDRSTPNSGTRLSLQGTADKRAVPAALGQPFIDSIATGLRYIHEGIDLGGSEVCTSSNLPRPIEQLEALPRPARQRSATARRYNNDGISAIQHQQDARAVELFMLAYRADPTDVEVTNNLAYALLSDGRLDEAEHYTLVTILMNPTRVNAWANLAQVYALRRDFRTAATSFAIMYCVSKTPEKTRQFLERLRAENPHEDIRVAANNALSLNLFR